MNFTDALAAAINASTSTVVPPPPECLRPETVSKDTILKFVAASNATLLVCSVASAALQLHVLSRALGLIRGKTADKCLHVFLFCMTLADFVLTGICYPIDLAQRVAFISEAMPANATSLLPWLPRLVNIALVHLLTWIALIVSSISLIFMNLDKLVYIKCSLRYTEYFTRRRAVYAASASWLGASAFVVTAFMLNSFQCHDANCQRFAMFPGSQAVYIVFVLVVGVLPSVTSLSVAVYIMQIMKKHRAHIKQEKLLCNNNAPAVAKNGAPIGAAHNARRHSAFFTRMRTFYFVFVTTLFTALTLLPYRIASIQRTLAPDRTPDCSTILIRWSLLYLVMLNSICNPLLTISVLPQYRIRWSLDACSGVRYQKANGQTSFKDLDGSGRDSY